MRRDKSIGVGVNCSGPICKEIAFRQTAKNSIVGRSGSDYAYSAYGEVATLGPDGGNDLQYATLRNDGTALYYSLYRYYDPVLKQWISEDPIGLAGDSNGRQYVDGDPISRYDPLGLWAWGDPIDQRIVNAVAGFGSGASLGLTDYVNDSLGYGDQVDQCSDAYRAGNVASFALGAGRLAYAGLAKGISIAASSGAAASAARAQLRVVFGGGKTLRPPNLAKYTMDAELRAGAGKTNRLANAYGAGVAAKSALGACGCP